MPQVRRGGEGRDHQAWNPPSPNQARRSLHFRVTIILAGGPKPDGGSSLHTLPVSSQGHPVQRLSSGAMREGRMVGQMATPLLTTDPCTPGYRPPRAPCTDHSTSATVSEQSGQTSASLPVSQFTFCSETPRGHIETPRALLKLASWLVGTQALVWRKHLGTLLPTLAIQPSSAVHTEECTSILRTSCGAF